MGTILNRIVEAKRREMGSSGRSGRLQKPVDSEASRPSLKEALKRDGLNIISEIKYRSPSHGPFRCRLSPGEIGRRYSKAGAAAISVLTDEAFFGGSLQHLSDVFGALRFEDWDREGEVSVQPESVPLLRKDFILESGQLEEARDAGASAFLLIVSCLDRGELEVLRTEGEELGMEALVEVHDPFELETAVESGARLIGVNNRNLNTFEVNVETSFELARRLEGEEGFLLVAESGLSERRQLVELKDAGFSGFLIGSRFMESDDPGTALVELLQEG